MCDYVSPHDTFKLFVTHIENVGNHLVVWGQRDREAALAIEQTLFRHKCAFVEGKSSVDITEVCAGQLCCAAYVDDSFYRARVVRVNAENRRVTVFFVDYGNVETVSISAIRSLAGVGGPVADTLQIATSYLVSRLLSNWTPQKLDFVSDQLKYGEFICALEGNIVHSPPLITIMYMGNDYAEYLASHGLGSFVPLQQFEGHTRSVFSGANVPAQNNPNPMWQRMMPPNSVGSTVNVPPMMNGMGPVPNSQMPLPGMQSMGVGAPSLGAQGSVPNHMVAPMCQDRVQSVSPRLPPPALAPSPPTPMVVAPLSAMTRQYIRMKLPPQKPLQYKSNVLEPGVKYPVLVSHVEDGPLAFSVQLMERHPELESLMQEINSQNPEPVSGPLHAGLMCLARFMGDMSLCRALILLITEENRTCKVYYVDYGNSDTVSYTHVFAIPDEFALPKVLSYRFALRGADSETCTLEMKKIFRDMVQCVEATLVVAEPDGQPNKHLGDLFIDGKNVKLLLKEKVKKKTVAMRYPKVQLPREGSRDEVVISFVEETFKFFVQLSSYSDALNNLMESVHNHCTGGSAQPLTPDEKIPGMPCCAMYTDGNWYRAVILNCFGDDVVVMYVDYGNEAKVKFSDLLNITPPIVSELRVQAIPCLLHEGKSFNHKLKEIEEQAFTMHIISQKDAFVTVQLFDSSGNDIVESSAATKPRVTSPPSDGWGEISTVQQQSFNDRGKGRSSDKSKAQSPGENSGFNEDQNWRKPGRSEYNVNNEATSKPMRSFGDDDKGFGDNRRNGGRFGDRGDQSRAGFGDDDKRSRGFGDRPRGDRGDNESRFEDKPRGGFGDRGGRFGDRDDNPRGGFGDRDKPRGGFGDRDDKPRGGFGDRDDKPRGGFGDRDDKPRGGFGDRDDKPRGGFGDRDKPRGGFGDRGGRFGDRDDKPRGGFGDRDDKPRGGFGDRGGRFGDRDDNPRGGFGDRDDKPRGGFGNRDDKPRGGFGDRGGRFGDRERRGGDREDGGRFGGKGGRFGDRNEGDGRFGDRSGGGRFGDRSGGDFGVKNSFSAPVAAQGENWDDATPTTKSDSTPTFPFTDLEGKSEDVGLVFGDPSKFFVHKRPKNPDFTHLTETISSTYSEGNESHGSGDVTDGLLCIAFSADYQGWYRARVINSIEGGAHVSFIDYGNEGDVYYDSMKKINDDLKTLPPQAIPCTLRGVPAKEWSEDEIGEFVTFAEAELRATFVEFIDGVFSTVITNTANQETANEKFGATPESLLPVAATYYVPDMVVENGSSAQVEVSWFINPSRFYIQFLSSRTELTNLLQSIQDNFKKLKPLKTCDVGWFVLAASKDDKVIYRAQVKKVDSPNQIGVEFIDYGNGELVEMSSVYSMEPDYVSMPRQAVRSKLDGVAPVGEVWPSAGTSDLDNSFMGETTCTVNRVDADGVLVVSLNRGGVDVAGELVEKNFAVQEACAGGEVQEIDIDLLPGQVVSGRVTYVNTEEKRLWVALEKSVADQLQEEIALCTAEPGTLIVFEAESIANGIWCLVLTGKSNYLRAEMIDSTCASGVLVRLADVGSCEEVTPDKIYYLPEMISLTPAQSTEFVFDGSAEVGQEVMLKILLSDDGYSATLSEEDLCPLPILRRSAKVLVPYTNGTSVWIQLVSFEQNLAELLDKLFEAYDGMAEDSFSPSEGSLCAAKSVADEVWYRGRIAAMSEEGISVYYVDYGNTEVIPKENLRELLPDFKGHAFAREMQLTFTSAGDLSEEITELTSNVSLDAEFATRDSQWQIEVVMDGVKLSQNLIDLGKATRREDSFFPEEFTGYLAHLESLSEIYVHKEKEYANLEALQAELQTLAETLEDGTQETGSVCLALFKDDGMWYRAEILAHGRAQFIDYGNADNVEQVKQLPEDKVQLKRYALKCSVKAPEDREWTPEDATRATGLLCEAITVKVLEDGDPKIVEMAVDGRDLKTELIQGVTEELPMDDAGNAAFSQLPADDYPEEANGIESGVIEDSADTVLTGDEIATCTEEVLVEETGTSEAFKDEGLSQVNGTESPCLNDSAQVDEAESLDLDHVHEEIYLPEHEEERTKEDPEEAEGTEDNGVTCEESTHEDIRDTEPACANETLEKTQDAQLAYEHQVHEDEGYEKGHKGKLAEVNDSVTIEPAYEVIHSQVEDTQVTESVYETGPVQVKDTQDFEPMYETGPVQVKDTQDSEPMYETEPVQVGDAQDSEPIYEAEPVQVEDSMHQQSKIGSPEESDGEQQALTGTKGTEVLKLTVQNEVAGLSSFPQEMEGCYFEKTDKNSVIVRSSATEVIRASTSNGPKVEGKEATDGGSETLGGNSNCESDISDVSYEDTLPRFVLATVGNYEIGAQTRESENCDEEETENHNGIGALLESVKSMPCTSTGDVCEDFDYAHRYGRKSADPSHGALKKVEDLLCLTDELLAETSEPVETAKAAPNVVVDK